MKLILPRTALVRALAAVKAAAGTTTPILANVLIRADEKSVTFTGSDLDLNLRQTIPLKTMANGAAIVTDTGKTTVRAGLLHDIARSAVGDTVALNLVRNALHVECGTVKFKLATLDPEEFPPFPRLKEPVEFTLDEATLHSMLARTVFATSSDADRFILNGSFLQLNGDLNVAALDGRRLGLATNADVSSKKELNLILPAKAVRELLRLLTPGGAAKENATKVTVAANANMAQFTFGETILLTKLIEGSYPPFRKIIPKSEVAVASIQRADLLLAVERIALVADAVRLEFRKQSLLISSSRAGGDKKDLFGEASDSLLCASTKELTIILGARYLRDALTACAVEELQFFAEDNVAMFKSPKESWLAVIAGMNEGDGKEKAAPPVTKTAAPAAKTKPVEAKTEAEADPEIVKLQQENWDKATAAKPVEASK